MLLVCPLSHFIWCFHGSSFSHSRQVFGEKYVEIVFASTSSSFTVNGLQVIKYITFRSIYYGYKKKLSFLFFSTIISTDMYTCKCLHIIMLVRFSYIIVISRPFENALINWHTAKSQHASKNEERKL